MFGLNSKSQEEIQVVKQRVLARFPLLGVTMMDLPIIANHRAKTACTNGKRVYYNPKYFEKLSDNQKEFLLAHEVMHIAFNHILRSKNRDHELWNTATDAVINQMLSKEGLSIKPGFVDIKWASKYSAEEVYDILLKNKQGKGGGDNQFDTGNADKADFKSHSMWKKAVKKAEKEMQKAEQKQQQSQSGQGQPQDQDAQNQPKQEQSQNQDGKENEQKQQQSQSGQDQPQDQGAQNQPKQEQSQNQDSKGNEQKQQSAAEDPNEQEKHDKEQQQNQNIVRNILRRLFNPNNGSDDSGQEAGQCQRCDHFVKNVEFDTYEKEFLEKNKQERHQEAEQVREKLNKQKVKVINSNNKDFFGSVGTTSKTVTNWKKLLKKALEDDVDRWSYRRSSADNDYMARVEDLEGENRPDTEVILDTSGSISSALLREFLKQLKPLLKDSKMKVGCFDTCFYGFQEIKKTKDIDTLVVQGGGGTDLNIPPQCFTPKKELNKIVFTDGEGRCNQFPRSKKQEDIIWIVWKNKKFNPCCGRVIYVSPKDILACVEYSFFNKIPFNTFSR